MTTEPPYLRIAGEIRRRIASGELGPGDPVPSTRRITQEWGVAMATATKALGALAQEGLVRAVPGVGTVVAESGRERATTQGRQLSRERVIRAAIALVDEEGLAALSMRRIATEFGTSTMALYRHVPGKGELVRLMSDAACAEVPLGPVPDDWRTGLERAARWLWEVYTRHRWMAPAMAAITRPVASPHAMAYTEWVLTALRPTPLSPFDKLHVHLTIFSFVQGLAMAADLEEQAQQDSGISDGEWMARNEPRFEAISAAGSYPLLNGLTERSDFELSLDTLFRFGLGRTLDGIAIMIGETSA